MATNRLHFLWKASHEMMAVPGGNSTSSFLMQQFLSQASDRDLRLAEDIQKRACAACGSIFIPGVNCKVRIEPVKETKREKEIRKRKARLENKKKKMMSKEGESSGDAVVKKAIEKEEMEETDKKTSNTTVKATGQKGQDNNIPIEIDTNQDTNSNDQKSRTNATKLTPTTTTSTTKTTAVATKSSAPNKESKKTIRIIPWTSMFQQENQLAHLNQKRSYQTPQSYQDAMKQLQKHFQRQRTVRNNVIYDCERCHRKTELQGSTVIAAKNARPPVTPEVLAKRKLKKKVKKQTKQQQQQHSGSESVNSISVTPMSRSSSVSSLTSVDFGGGALTPFSQIMQEPPQVPQVQRLQQVSKKQHIPAASAPVSAHGSPKLSGSPSPYTSVPVSPRGGGAGAASSSLNEQASKKKKKKMNLQNLLAAQKSRDAPPPPGPSDGAGGGGLLSFLSGL